MSTTVGFLSLNQKFSFRGSLSGHFSSFFSRSANSGNRANQKYASLNLSSGRAGVPQTV